MQINISRLVKADRLAVWVYLQANHPKTAAILADDLCFKGLKEAFNADVLLDDALLPADIVAKEKMQYKFRRQREALRREHDICSRYPYRRQANRRAVY